MSVEGEGTGGGYARVPMPPKVRFEVLTEAWDLLIKQFGVWFVAGLAFVVPVAVLIGGLSAIMMAQMAALGRMSAGNHDLSAQMLGLQLQFYGISLPAGILFSAFDGIIEGGMVRMAFRQMRGESIGISDIFKIGDVFWPLAVIGILQNIAVQVGSMFCLFPGIILGGLLLLAIPLVTERRMSAMNAIRESVNALKTDLVNASLLCFLLSLIVSLGGFVCGIGTAFTFPLMPITMALLYRDFYPREVPPSSFLSTDPTAPTNPWATN